MSARRRRSSQPARIAVRHWIALVILVTTTSGLGIVTASIVADRTEPVTWGTFTEERCIAARRGCQSFGSWVSDDGRSRLDDAVLQGTPDADRTVASFYRPTDTFNDGPPWVVRTRSAEDSLLWTPLALLALFLGASAWMGTTMVRARRRMRVPDVPADPEPS